MPVVYNYTNLNKTKTPRLKKSEVLFGIVGMAGRFSNHFLQDLKKLVG